MNPSHEKYAELRLLISQSAGGSITPEGMQRLNEILLNDSEARHYYQAYVHTEVILRTLYTNEQHLFDPAASNTSSDQDYMEALRQLAEIEKNAPALTIEAPKPEKVTVKMLKIEKPPRVINKFSLYSAIISAAAAVIFVFIYVKMAPKAASQAAMITDSMNAQWAKSGYPMDVGEYLWDNEGTRWLQRGTVKLEFGYGVEVIIEGPAEFELESTDEMTLLSGRLYAMVPKGATGFTVQTPYSTVIDLGTEFGIKVDFDGTTDVHMFKGRASLIPGSSGEKDKGQELTAGQARAVTKAGAVQNIALDKQAFVRRFDSEAGLLWRGDDIDLADIVGGGNGFGTGTLNHGIDVVTGGFCQDLHTVWRESVETGFRRVLASELVDGVFSVNNHNGPIIVDSVGHHFELGYKNRGHWGYVMNGAFHESDNVPRHTLVLDGQLCGTEDNPAIGMHACMGITFDIEAIREQTPGTLVTRFTALAGVSETIGNFPEGHTGKADFWVLLDGEVKFNCRLHWQDGGSPIDLPIFPEHRFLTLITTDAGDSTGCDWSLFASPRLNLVSDNSDGSI